MQGDPYGTIWRPGEADVSIRPGWFWHPDQDERVRNADNLMRLYFRSVGRNSKLLLNVPPTRDGLFHDCDVRALEAFDEKRRALFDRDVLTGGRVRASGGSTPGAVLDADGDNHWRAPDGTTSAWLEVELPAPAAFDTLRLEEAIELGQHIANHRVDVWREGRWQRWRGARPSETPGCTTARRRRHRGSPWWWSSPTMHRHCGASRRTGHRTGRPSSGVCSERAPSTLRAGLAGRPSGSSRVNSSMRT